MKPRGLLSEARVLPRARPKVAFKTQAARVARGVHRPAERLWQRRRGGGGDAQRARRSKRRFSLVCHPSLPDRPVAIFGRGRLHTALRTRWAIGPAFGASSAAVRWGQRR